eukprot:m.66292 g.66292  ORF g.66292 m.66292 type:complete len:406 (+) comp23669_c0_seq3:356-1573(+)
MRVFHGVLLAVAIISVTHAADHDDSQHRVQTKSVRRRSSCGIANSASVGAKLTSVTLRNTAIYPLTANVNPSQLWAKSHSDVEESIQPNGDIVLVFRRDNGTLISGEKAVIILVDPQNNGSVVSINSTAQMEYGEYFGLLRINGYTNTIGEFCSAGFFRKVTSDVAPVGNSQEYWPECVSRPKALCTHSPCCQGMFCDYVTQVCNVETTSILVPQTGDSMDRINLGVETANTNTSVLLLKKDDSPDSGAIIAGSILAAVSILGGLGVLTVYYRRTHRLGNDDDEESVHGAKKVFKRLESDASYGYDEYPAGGGSSDSSTSDDDDDADDNDDDHSKHNVTLRPAGSRMQTQEDSNDSGKSVPFDTGNPEDIIYVPRDVYTKVKNFRRSDVSSKCETEHTHGTHDTC